MPQVEQLLKKSTTTHLTIDLVEPSLGPDAKEEIYIFLKVKIGITHWDKHKLWAQTDFTLYLSSSTNKF